MRKRLKKKLLKKQRTPKNALRRIRRNIRKAFERFYDNGVIKNDIRYDMLKDRISIKWVGNRLDIKMVFQPVIEVCECKIDFKI